MRCRRFFGGNPFMGGHVFRAGGFGGGHPFAQRPAAGRQQGGRGPAQQQQQPNPMLQLVQLAPLLLLLFFTFLSSRSQPTYSLHRTREYSQEFATATYEVPFWVPDAAALHKQYPPGSRER